MDCTVSRSRRSTWFIAQVLLVGLCAMMTSSSSCEFPAFMTQMSYWKTQVTQLRTGALWTFPTPRQAKRTDFTPGKRSEITLFSCHKAIDHETFLTSISPDGATASSSSYQCLRFIRRTDFVVQLATSAIFNTISEDRCRNSTQLVLQDLVLVHPVRNEALVTDVISCGLDGGYWLSVIDSSGSHTCQDSFLRPIIEADCVSPGEGVLIDFRQPSCSIFIGTATLHQMGCLGSWTQSGSIYSILTDNKRWPTLWMLRIPEVASGPVTALLMTSLSTSSAHNADAHQYALSLTPASFPTLCENEASRCNVTTDCADNAKEVHCQKTCDACAVTTGGLSCEFNETYHGQWFEMSRRYSAADDTNRIVTVSIGYTVLLFVWNITGGDEISVVKFRVM